MYWKRKKGTFATYQYFEVFVKNAALCASVPVSCRSLDFIPPSTKLYSSYTNEK